MSKKRVNYSKPGTSQLPNDKPALYRIRTKGGKQNYAGIAKRGRVSGRIAEHLGEVPGATVEIEQFDSIGEARAKESRVIKRSKPKYNKQGK